VAGSILVPVLVALLVKVVDPDRWLPEERPADHFYRSGWSKAAADMVRDEKVDPALSRTTACTSGGLHVW
jgi:hypothetical protein